MSKRVEIEPAPNGLAWVKTYVNGKLTSIHGPMTRRSARQTAAEHSGVTIVNHITDEEEK